MKRLLRPWRKLARQLYLLYYRKRLSLIRGLVIGEEVVFKGKPLIGICRGAAIEIGDGAMINSSNAGYHINMHSPVKLLADREGARITIGPRTRIHGTCVHAYRSVSIGANCLIAANCQIMDGNGHEASFDNVENRIQTHGDALPVVIEDHVWIGANCLVLPGVRIGRGSIVAAGSVVVHDIPSMVVAAGNPAKTIRTAEPGRAVPTVP